MIDLNQYLVGSSPYDNAYALKYSDGEYSLETRTPMIVTSKDDIQHTVKEGETLQNLSFRYYKDSGKWYIIAEANGILNPFKELTEGLILRIPSYAR